MSSVYNMIKLQEKVIKTNKYMIFFIVLNILLTQQTISTQITNDKQILTTTDNNTITNTSTVSMIITNIQTIPEWLNGSLIQYNSFLLDDYNYYITSKGNKVWVATMQLAWNQVCEKFIDNQNISFIQETQILNKMTSNFNKKIFTAKQLNQKSYYVNSGYGKSMIKLINQQVKNKFPMKQFPELVDTMKETDFISYAYLYKQFYFKKAFNTMTTTFRFNNISVEAFQAKTSKQKAQIYYKYYTDRDNFLMGIQTASSYQQIWILKTNNTNFNSLKMSKVMEIMNMYEKLPNKRIKRRDQFAMPVLNFSFKRTYSEFIGKQFSNQQLKSYKIGQMNQRIDFKLTKDGVKLQAQAILISISNFVTTKKIFILDKPFWIILKETNRKPYLIIEVNNVSESCTIN